MELARNGESVPLEVGKLWDGSVLPKYIYR